MKVLGIETSCDESAVALYDGHDGLLGHRVHSQVELHARYGGVVPELASRDHVRKVLPLLEDLLGEHRLSPRAIDAVAFTRGPGLVGALLVGAALGRSLAFALGVPSIGVHHMEGHLLAPLLERGGAEFPFVALLVSGGHTMLVDVADVGRYEVLGESLDDAAGEAFDKTATLLGLGYPGGPALAALAREGRPERYRFPRPMTDRPGLDFSFSGLKTHAMTTLRDAPDDHQTRADIALAFEVAVVETLMIKCRRALEHTARRSLVIAGGVGANARLRERARELAARDGTEVHYPPVDLCTDNAAMIAYAGWRRLVAGHREPLAFAARPRWPLGELHAL